MTPAPTSETSSRRAKPRTSPSHRHSSHTLLQVRMLLPKRPLRARTFRLGAGQTIAIGGVARVDVVTAPAATLYLTLWASDEVTTHFGKTEGADERCARPTP